MRQKFYLYKFCEELSIFYIKYTQRITQNVSCFSTYVYLQCVYLKAVELIQFELYTKTRINELSHDLFLFYLEKSHLFISHVYSSLIHLTVYNISYKCVYMTFCTTLQFENVDMFSDAIVSGTFVSSIFDTSGPYIFDISSGLWERRRQRQSFRIDSSRDD